MPQPLASALDDLRALILDPRRLVRAVAAGRRRSEHPTHRRVELRWVDLRGDAHLQVVRYDERQSFTENVALAEAPVAVDGLLAEPYGNWHVVGAAETVQVRVTKKGDAQVHRSAGGGLAGGGRAGGGPAGGGPAGDSGAGGTAADGVLALASHDRRKPRMLEPGDAYLRAVGISDESSRIKPSRQAKYRQVEEFLRALDPVLAPAVDAAGTDALRVADLGCGNAYLSFAAYQWLSRGRGLSVRLTGVDVKAQARARNAALAADLGWSAEVGFVEAAIGDAALDARPHLVLALHACDTATDDALARAVRWRTPVILAAPCCHHDVQRQLRAAQARAPHPYGLVTRHGILRERLADVLTDAARAAVLRLLGYRVEVIEFVDSAHTPRNTLLRAVWTGVDPSADLVEEYQHLLDAWAIRPALADRLGPELAAVPGLPAPVRAG